MYIGEIHHGVCDRKSERDGKSRQEGLEVEHNAPSVPHVHVSRLHWICQEERASMDVRPNNQTTDRFVPQEGEDVTCIIRWFSPLGQFRAVVMPEPKLAVSAEICT